MSVIVHAVVSGNLDEVLVISHFAAVAAVVGAVVAVVVVEILCQIEIFG